MVAGVNIYLIYAVALVVSAAVVWISLEKHKPLGYMLLFITVMVWGYVLGLWEEVLSFLQFGGF
jgi:hypothetical protein